MSKQIIKMLTFTVLSFILTSCASVIKTTGPFNYDSVINNVTIICYTPEIVQKFSNDLCNNLKTNLEQKGLKVKTIIIGEMNPSLDSDTKELDISDTANIVIKIKHIRVSLYNGMPCNTLMNVEIFNNQEDKLIWAARIYTKGTNLTGPGNPEKVSMEIINQMIADGLKI